MATTANLGITLIDSQQAQQDVIMNEALVTLDAAIAETMSGTLPLQINPQTGTAYTLELTDAGALITLDNAASIGVTVPDESEVDFPVGTQVLLMQKGDGQVTVVPGATGVEILSPETLQSRKKGAQMALVKIAADTWALEGNLEAA